MQRGKSICILYVLFVCFGIPKKPLPVCHRFNRFKEIQHSDANNSNKKKEKNKKFSV